MEAFRAMLNGPVVAGVGATVDPGLTRDKYHVVPWDPSKRVQVALTFNDDGMVIGSNPESRYADIPLDELINYAIYNVKKIFNFDVAADRVMNMTEEFRKNIYLDMIAILLVALSHGHYDIECREATTAERSDIMAQKVTDEEKEEVFNPTRINRAATYLLARMHTKYQTNHAIGGNPMQASMASAVRAHFGLSPSNTRENSKKQQLEFLATCLYWSTHPANECLLIPMVIQNTKINTATVHAHGPEPITVVVDEYFQIRAKTPPASTHHYYVAAAALRQLEPMGIIQYLPAPSRVEDVLYGLRLIEKYGAALHPAARFWGLARITSNQKIVEPLCADLGYAIRRLVPGCSLSGSPILCKEDGLNLAWKSLVDSLRIAMDDRGKEMLGDEVFDAIKDHVAPRKAHIKGLKMIKRFLDGAAPGDDSGSEGDDDEDEDDKRGNSGNGILGDDGPSGSRTTDSQRDQSTRGDEKTSGEPGGKSVPHSAGGSKPKPKGKKPAKH